MRSNGPVSREVLMPAANESGNFARSGYRRFADTWLRSPGNGMKRSGGCAPSWKNRKRAAAFGRSGKTGLARRIDGNSAVPHHARFVHVPWHRAMEQAAVVPYHRIARGPGVMVSPRRLAREIHQVLKQSFRLGFCHPRDVVSVAAD